MGRGLKRSRLVVAVLLVLAFTLITIDYRTGRGSGGPRGAVHGLLGGIENGVTAVTRPIGRTASSLFHANRYHDQADRLTQENAALRRQLADQGQIDKEAAELSALRLLADRGQYTVVPAKVVALGDVTGTDWTVTVNAGIADGLSVDKIVLNQSGLVGTVVSVTAHSAVVRLYCDPRSRVGARLEGSGLLGAVVGGNGPDKLVFTLYDASYRVRPGQRLVTFGSLDYVAGVPIGEITKVTEAGGLTQTAEVRPYVSVGTLDLVGIVVGKPSTDPGDRALPPRPLASASPAAPPAAAAPSPSVAAAAPTGGGR